MRQQKELRMAPQWGSCIPVQRICFLWCLQGCSQDRQHTFVWCRSTLRASSNGNECGEVYGRHLDDRQWHKSEMQQRWCCKILPERAVGECIKTLLELAHWKSTSHLWSLSTIGGVQPDSHNSPYSMALSWSWRGCKQDRVWCSSPDHPNRLWSIDPKREAKCRLRHWQMLVW